jgi:hypothetical protein
MSPTNRDIPFAVDPYPHQPDSTWKVDRCISDQRILCESLGLSREDVFAASERFHGRSSDLLRFIIAVRFLMHAIHNELQERATTLKIASLIFTIEGVAPVTLRPNRKRVEMFLVRYLAREDKLRLLGNFLFSRGHPIGVGEADHPRHLMIAKALADTTYRKANWIETDPNFCSTGQQQLCFCSMWLAEQGAEVIDNFTKELANKLYDMRNAVTHDAVPVFFASSQEERPADTATWSMMLVDAYSHDNREVFTTYESGIFAEEIATILSGALAQCFMNGADFSESHGLPA